MFHLGVKTNIGLQGLVGGGKPNIVLCGARGVGSAVFLVMDGMVGGFTFALVGGYYFLFLRLARISLSSASSRLASFFKNSCSEIRCCSPSSVEMGELEDFASGKLGYRDSDFMVKFCLIKP